MTFIKRGLGRGLEVLLADVSSMTGMKQGAVASNDTDDQLADALAAITHLQLENRMLLSEVERLKNLLDELEAIIRADLDIN